MKNKVFLLFGLVALVTLFAWQSCDLVKVDSPEMDVTSEYTPEYTIKGVVTNADNQETVAGATLTVGDVTFTTNDEGSYSYTSEIAFESGEVVVVEADGFVKSTSKLVFGDDAPIEYLLDFSLTRELPASMVNLSNGGEIAFDGGFISIPENNSVVLADGSQPSVIEVSVTPLSPFSTLGNWVGTSLKKLMIEPVGATFEHPITVKIDFPEDEVYEELYLYSFDEVTNEWVSMDNVISYDAAEHQISFQLKNTGGPLNTADPTTITIIHDKPNELDTLTRYSPSTCDCELSTFWFGGWWLRQLVFVEGSGSINELNTLHFFTDYNMSYSDSLVNGIYVIPAVPYPGVTLGQCEQANVDTRRWYREVKGTYDFEGETGKTFTVRFYYGLQVLTEYGGCETWTNCHQGCN